MKVLVADYWKQEVIDNGLGVVDRLSLAIGQYCIGTESLTLQVKTMKKWSGFECTYSCLWLYKMYDIGKEPNHKSFVFYGPEVDPWQESSVVLEVVLVSENKEDDEFLSLPMYTYQNKEEIDIAFIPYPEKEKFMQVPLKRMI